MKQLLLAIACVAVTATTYAQKPAALMTDNTPAVSEAATVNIPTDPDNVFANTTMSIANKVVNFQNLPAAHKTDAYVTDANGEAYRDKKLTAANSSIDLSRVAAGLYYITLMNKGQRKAYMVHL